MLKTMRMSRRVGTFIIIGGVVAAVSGIMFARQAAAADLSGTIEGLSADGASLVVNGQTLVITPQTDIEGTLVVGAAIEANVAAQADGSLVALEVSVADSEDANGENDSTDENTSDNADEDTDQEEVKIEGTIDTLSADGTSLVVNGQTLIITPQTEIEGTLVVGAAIEADVATQVDGSLVALKVSVADSEDVNEENEENDEHDGPDEDTGGQHVATNAQLGERAHTRAGEEAHSADKDIDQEEAEISGTIDSLSADGTSLVVDGQTLIITPQTEIEGTLAVGAAIEADVATQADGSLVALGVSIESGED